MLEYLTNNKKKHFKGINKQSEGLKKLEKLQEEHYNYEESQDGEGASQKVYC